MRPAPAGRSCDEGDEDCEPEIHTLVAAGLLPVMPTKALELLGKVGLDQAGAEAMLRGLVAGGEPLQALSVGQAIYAGDPLFPRHRELPASIASLFVEAAPEEPAALPELDWIEFPDFPKVQLRVGHILAAEAHPHADKLLVLQVDVGEARPRTICAGIKSTFAPAALVGRKVVVVVN